MKIERKQEETTVVSIPTGACFEYGSGSAQLETWMRITLRTANIATKKSTQHVYAVCLASGEVHKLPAETVCSAIDVTAVVGSIK